MLERYELSLSWILYVPRSFDFIQLGVCRLHGVCKFVDPLLKVSLYLSFNSHLFKTWVASSSSMLR